MKRKITYWLCWTALLSVMVADPSPAQESPEQLLTEIASKCREGLTIFTDRTFYAVNENICFTGKLQINAYPYNAPESSVLYVDLIDPEGKSVIRAKYPVIQGESQGALPIPSHILSGTYYLRTYTRWMQNFGEGDFVYLPLRIINPFQSETAPSITGAKGELLPNKPIQRGIRVQTKQSTYYAGEMVEVECRPQVEWGDSIPFACLTVVPDGAIDTSFLAYRVMPETGSEEEFHLDYLPDIGGITISGKTAADVRIHFSLLGQNPAHLVARSDSRGRFIVKIPTRFGNQEMFVCTEAPGGAFPEVNIDNDFSTAGLPFAPAPFVLDEKERRVGSRIALHMQLELAYAENSENIILPVKDNNIHRSFYGSPDISIQVNEFVNLPNMEEVIENLVPVAHVKQRRGAKFISVESENPLISFFPPLILVDHIPVFDPETALAIPPSRIERVEVVPRVYAFGFSLFGGIISFLSPKGDLAGIHLPETSYFFDYLNFHPPSAPLVKEQEESGFIPDTRNTLYWSDRAAIPGGASFHAAFRAPSIPGDYVVLYRGILPDCEPIYGLSRFKTIPLPKPGR